MKNMGRQREFYCFKTCDSFVRYGYERQVSNSHHIIFSQRFFTLFNTETGTKRYQDHRAYVAKRKAKCRGYKRHILMTFSTGPSFIMLGLLGLKPRLVWLPNQTVDLMDCKPAEMAHPQDVDGFSGRSFIQQCFKCLCRFRVAAVRQRVASRLDSWGLEDGPEVLPKNPMDSLQIAGIQDGDHLTVAQPAKVKGARHAFAMWCCGDGMVTWGNPASWLTDRS